MARPWNPLKRLSPLWRWTYVSTALLVLVLGAEYIVAERTAVTTFLLYMPQQPWGVLPLVLTLWSWRRGDRRATMVNGGGLLAFAALLLGFNVPFGASKGDKPAIRMLTYNTHYTEGGIPAVAQTIQVQGAEIVCLQETPTITGISDGKRPVRWSEVFGRRFPGWKLVQAGEVTTMTRWPVIRERRWPLPATEPRFLLETVIQTPSGPLSVFNAHFDSAYKRPSNATTTLSEGRIGHALQDSTRGPGIRAAQFAVIQPVLSSCTRPFVLAGDFNNPPRGELYGSLSELGTDAFRAAGWGSGFTFPSGLPLMRIDYFWLGRGVTASSCRVVGSRASDHRPLVAEISLPLGVTE